ncbi:hypothetical protein [Aquabacterium sp.]|uniref:hypothetical protein n=1 Tax=Aquabacterium sp. TaxID=1872578 RepID=UPI003BAFEDEA
MAKNITNQAQAPITFAVPKVLAEVFKLQSDTTALRKRHRIRIARSKHKALFGQPDPDKTDDWYLAQERPIAEETQKSPMATPNCSTVGQSNCSRQDGVIMRGRA